MTVTYYMSDSPALSSEDPADAGIALAGAATAPVQRPYWTAHVKDPRSPVGKFKLSELMNHDQRASYKHRMLWDFHLGWSHSEYNDTSLASVRTIERVLSERSPTGRALSRNHISKANRDLCEWGYLIELTKGTGTAASRFAINWDLLAVAAAGLWPACVHPVGDASTPGACVHHVGDASVHPMGDASAVSVHLPGDKDLSTPDLSKTEVRGVERINGSAAPSAPPPTRPVGPAGAGSAEGDDSETSDRFTALWDAYGVRKGKVAARSVYESMAVTDEQHEDIVQAAAAWRKAAPAGMTRKSLVTWLKEELYDEDPPKPFEPRKAGPASSAASAPTPARAGNDNAGGGVTHTLPYGVHDLIETCGADVVERKDGKDVVVRVMTFGPDNWGKEWKITIPFEDRRAAVQAAGQRALCDLARACGLSSIENTDELKQKGFRANAQSVGIKFFPRVVEEVA